MAVPNKDTNQVRGALVNVIIDEKADSPHVAAFGLNVEDVSFPIQPANSPHPIGTYLVTEIASGTITFEQTGDAMRRFLFELAAVGESSKSSIGGIKPTHSIRVNDPADTGNANDILFHKVELTNVREEYAEGEVGKLKILVDWKAMPVSDGGADDGKIYTIGRALV